MAQEDKETLISESDTADNNYGAANSSSGDNEKGEKKNSESAKNSWTREQKLTAVSMALMNFSTQVSFAVIAPFYPVEAAKKGATSTEIGLIFGIFQLVIFITAPIYGRFIEKIGGKTMFISGSILCGVCNIVFGFLDEVKHRDLYIALSFISRMLEANGASMMSVASFAIMANQFQKNVGSALGALKTFAGVGMALGPTIGGGLYTVGGYKTPFIVVGGVVIVTAIVSAFVLPSAKGLVAFKGSFLQLMKSGGCIVMYLVVVGSSMALSATDPLFSPYMSHTLGLTAGWIGFMFMVAPAVYAIVAPLCGYISDKGWHGSLAAVGSLVNGISFLLLGPSPLLQHIIPASIGEMVVALVLQGLSVGCILMPVFPLVIRLSKCMGYEENLHLYGIISGFFNSSSALGAFIGPSLSGYLGDKLGFPWSMTINGAIIFSLGLMVMTYITHMKCKGRWPLPDPTEDDDDEKTLLS